MAKAVTLDALALLLSPRFPLEASVVGGMAALAIRRDALHRATHDVRWRVADRDEAKERLRQASALRDIFGNPFRPITFSPQWRTDTAVSLARQMYEARDFSAMPILADALQDAGCDSEDVLNHCRGDGPHVRGCWVVDLVLGRE
jgi:hypothetical protein